MKLNVDVKIDTTGLESKLNDLLKDDTLMLQVHALFAKMCDPYVPFLEGPLSQTVEIEPNCIRYVQPYARRQYYGVDFNHTLVYHPLASALWDKTMMNARGDEFKAQVRELLIRRAQQLWG